MADARIDTPRFTGWHRPRRWDSWRQVCQAEDEGSCWQILLGQVAGGEKCVLETGKRPDAAGPGMFGEAP